MNDDATNTAEPSAAASVDAKGSNDLNVSSSDGPTAAGTSGGQEAQPQGTRSVTQTDNLKPFVFDSDAPVPPDQKIFEGFLSQDDLVVWLGREKHRKTNVALQLAICAALGHGFLNFPFVAPRPQKVVMVDYETKTGKLKERYDAMVKELGLSNKEKKLLKKNLRIIEVRKMHKVGATFFHFPARAGSPDSPTSKFWGNFVKNYPADIYIFDPMRSMHSEDENKSNLLELLLAHIRRVLRKTVIITHHMRKSAGNEKYSPKLNEGMRSWAEGGRGSSALTAHADVIICQEQVMSSGNETVWWGSYSKDEADIEPMPLEETGPTTFFWRVSARVPGHLLASFKALKAAGGPWSSKAAVAQAIQQVTKRSRPTSFRDVEALRILGFLTNPRGTWQQTQPTSSHQTTQGQPAP